MSLFAATSVLSYVILLALSSSLFYNLINSLDKHNALFDILDLFSKANDIVLKVISQQSFINLMEEPNIISSASRNFNQKEIALSKEDLKN